MSNRKRKTDQPELPFSASTAVGITEEVYVGVRVMESIKRLMRARNLGRAELADHLAARLGRQIQITTVDMWFSPDKADRWPAFTALLVICEWLHSLEPLNALVDALGAAVIDRRGMTLLKIGQAYLDQRKLEIHRTDLERAVEAHLLEDLRSGA